MYIVRFADQGKVKYGVLEGNIIRGFRGSPFTQFKGPGTSFKFDGKTYKRDEVRLLSPTLPSKIVALALNYKSHAEEASMPLPPRPHIFIKPSTAVIGPDDRIILKEPSRRIDYEGELGVVIGQKATDVTEEKAKDYVLGYTCFNDVSDRDFGKEDNFHLTRAKGSDTFAPIGPWIATDIDPDDLKIETYLNGERRQSDRTSSLVFGVSKLISFISGIMTLLPGDVIATGTTFGIGRMHPGDVVEIRIEKIGTLRNFVASQK